MPPADAHDPLAPPPALRRMRFLAGALLAAMAGLYLALTALGTEAGLWGYGKAFAEAALVGGLADWFAVTALFRRPLGLPIPHTAVIPRNKERIATALGAFVATNFLAPAVVTERLKDQDLAGPLARRLADRGFARQAARGLLQAAPSLAAALDDPAVQGFMSRQAAALAADARIALVVGQGLEALAEQGRHQGLVDAALKEAAAALAAHAPAIRAMVRTKTDWFWRLLSADAKASDALIAALEETIQAIADDPDHPARGRVTEMIRDFAVSLQSNAALQGEIRAAATALIQDPRLAAAASQAWEKAKTRLAALAEEAPEPVLEALADGVTHLGRALEADLAARAAVNGRLKAMLADLAGAHGAAAAGLITETIRHWDAATMTAKLEAQVGSDLQYIRINGTLIGGCIGLALHHVTLWIAP